MSVVYSNTKNETTDVASLDLAGAFSVFLFLFNGGGKELILRIGLHNAPN
jgi:hypothetical protein